VDSETGFSYYRNRYYHLQLGRLVSRDPIGFEAGDANLYRYVGNGPIGDLDPTGLEIYTPPPPPPPPFPPVGAINFPPAESFIPPFVNWWAGKSAYLPKYPNLYPAETIPLPPVAIPAFPATPIPKGTPKARIQRLRADEGGKLYAPLPQGEYVGPWGCGECVGVIIVCPSGNVAVFHFHPGDAPYSVIGARRWPAGSRAGIARGKSAVRESRALYDAVMGNLECAGIPIAVVTPYAELYWGTGPQGPGWYMPPTTHSKPDP
jgi:RHS repeat-associated protein